MCYAVVISWLMFCSKHLKSLQMQLFELVYIVYHLLKKSQNHSNICSSFFITDTYEKNMPI